MSQNADHLASLNPWKPITDPLTLKHTGKLQEELGELMSAVARCQIQGVDEAEPVTGKLNREWLQEEMADVICSIGLLAELLDLDNEAMKQRALAKAERLRTWHAMQ